MEITLTAQDGKAIATSQQVAKTFRREHRSILRAIDALKDSLNAAGADGRSFTEHNFVLSEYTDATGRTLPAYNMTRDGFTMLAMGFTGAQATKFKLAYIDAFNRMEEQLRTTNLPGEPIKPFRLVDTFAERVVERPGRLVAEFFRAADEAMERGEAYMLPAQIYGADRPGKEFFGWYSDDYLYFTVYALRLFTKIMGKGDPRSIFAARGMITGYGYFEDMNGSLVVPVRRDIGGA